MEQNQDYKLTEKEQLIAWNVGCKVLVNGTIEGVNLGLYYPVNRLVKGNVTPNGVSVFFTGRGRTYVQAYSAIKLINPKPLPIPTRWPEFNVSALAWKGALSNQVDPFEAEALAELRTRHHRGTGLIPQPDFYVLQRNGDFEIHADPQLAEALKEARETQGPEADFEETMRKLREAKVNDAIILKEIKFTSEEEEEETDINEYLRRLGTANAKTPDAPAQDREEAEKVWEELISLANSCLYWGQSDIRKDFINRGLTECTCQYCLDYNKKTK